MAIPSQCMIGPSVDLWCSKMTGRRPWVKDAMAEVVKGTGECGRVVAAESDSHWVGSKIQEVDRRMR